VAYIKLVATKVNRFKRSKLSESPQVCFSKRYLGNYLQSQVRSKYEFPSSLTTNLTTTMDCFAAPAIRTRDAIQDIWGPRTPYKDEWPTRVDMACDEEPQEWVQSACVLCR
jgi:hypothetical protein